MSPPERDPHPRPAWLYSLARALLAAAVSRMSPARQPWGQAMLAELDQARTAVDALAWALGGVRVAWLDRRQRAPLEARRRAWAVVAGVAGLLAVTLGGLLPGMALLAAAAIVAGTGRVPVAKPGGAPPTQPVTRRPSVTARVAVGVGLFGHALAGPLVLAMAGLVAPPWALVGLAALWGGLLSAALCMRRARPWLVPAVPVVTLIVGFAVVSFGTGVLGWLP